MAETETPHVAHHFDTIEQQREAITLGMWLFLATEIMFFGGLFTAYAVYRSRDPLAFAEGSHHMDLVLGTLNTLLLLVSSYTVVLGVDAAQHSRRKMLSVFLLLTILLGLAFLGVKGYEYWHKYHEHHVPGPYFELGEPHYAGVEPRRVEMFYSLYFAMTGLHAAHMVIGVGIFGVLLVPAWWGGFSSAHYLPIEIAGLYWHFVDIVWVFLFPLLYLVG